MEEDFIRLEHISYLSRCCGHFDGGADVNNGYGCTHPDQEVVDDDSDGKEQGCCFAFSCPLGYEIMNDPDGDPEETKEAQELGVPEGEPGWIVLTGKEAMFLSQEDYPRPSSMKGEAWRSDPHK